MPTHRLRPREKDSDMVYVTRISLSEDEPSVRSGRQHSGSASSSDFSDSGFYNEIPVEVFLKPTQTKKVQYKPKKKVAPNTDTSGEGSRLYVYIPEDVSVSSDNEATIHHIRSGYLQNATSPKQQKINLVHAAPTHSKQTVYKVMPTKVTYTENRPRAELKTKSPSKTRKPAPIYQEIPSYKTFSQESYGSQGRQVSSPLVFKDTRSTQKVNSAVRKPTPIRPKQNEARLQNSHRNENSAFRRIPIQMQEPVIQKSKPKRQIYQSSEKKSENKVSQSAFVMTKSEPGRQMSREHIKRAKHFPVRSEYGGEIGRRRVPTNSSNPYPVDLYMDQDYENLWRKCQTKGKLFCDPEFPASDESVGYEIASYRRIDWKRPFVSINIFSPDI